MKPSVGARFSTAVVAAVLLTGCAPSPPADPAVASPAATADTRPSPSADASALLDTRPTSYVQTYRVDSTDVGKREGAYATLGAAVAAAQNDIKAEGSGITADLARSTPTRRRLITVAPGTYTEQIRPPSHVDIRGLGAKPSDTVFTWAATTTGATLETSGASTHISNLRIVDTSSVDTRHAMRDAGTGGDPDELLNRTRRTVVIEDVELVSSPTAGAKGGAIDMIPGQGTVMLFNRVTFDSPNQPQAISAVLGRGKAEDPPSTVTFADCRVVANKSVSDAAGIPQATVAHPVGLTDFGGGSQDKFFWYRGNFDVEGAAPVAGDITANYEAISGTRSGVQWFLDPTVLVKNQSNGAGVHAVGDGTPEIPVNGVSQDERNAYLPDTDADPSLAKPLAPAVLPTGRKALVPGRVYYVKVEVSAAMRPVSMRIGVGSGSGLVAGAYYIDQAGMPATDAALRVLTAPSAAHSGDQTMPLQARRRIWPGQRCVWIGFASSSATTTVDAVSDAVAAGLVVKYRDGWDGLSPLGPPGQLKDLPAGEAAPIPTLLS